MFSGGPEEPTASKKPSADSASISSRAPSIAGKVLANRVAEQRLFPLVELADSLVGQLVAKAAGENVAACAAEVELRNRLPYSRASTLGTAATS